MPAVHWTRSAKQAFSRVTHAGVTPHMRSALRKRLVVTNLFALTVAGITLFWFTVYAAFWDPILEDLMFVIVATGLLVPWMNARGLIVTSRLTILGVSSVIGATYALVMGPAAGIVIMLLPLACAPLALFDVRERGLMAVSLPLPVLLAVGVELYQVDHPALHTLPAEVIQRASVISLLTATALVGAMMSFLYAVHASAEARLEHSYQELLRQSDEVVLFVDPDGHIADANQEVERQLGHPRARLRGMPIWEIDAALTRDEWALLLARVEAGGPALLQHNYRRRDGSEYPVEVRLGLVGAGAKCVIVAARDISQRTELEARLRVADRLVSVGTLAAGVAHEVNNPLTYISLNLKRVQRRIADNPGGLSEQHRNEVLDSLRMALEGSAKVSTIVNDLKTFSRGSREEPAAVDIEGVLRSTLELAGLELGSRARVVTEFGRVPEVWGDEAKLAQVALNLVLNAVQAMHRGKQHDVLQVSTATDAFGRVVVCVSDTGCGIPQADLARIFDPFFTTKQAEGGTGLGLYVCRSIVTEGGGDIAVHSQPGHGTTFALTLPAAHAARAEMGAMFRAAHDGRSTRRMRPA